MATVGFSAMRSFSGLPSSDGDRTPGWRDAMRAQCCKVHEEAAELMVASKLYVDALCSRDGDGELEYRQEMLDEAADVVQALTNLAACMGVTDAELSRAMERCDERNARRGRFR